MEEGYLIGVDGGGTKTKAVAARTDGTVLATAVGGGLNAGQIGAGRAKENLLGVLKRLTRALDGQAARVVVGDPSLDGPAPPSTAGRACRTRGRWLNAHSRSSNCARRAL